MFDWEGKQAKIKSWLRQGIIWKLGDAADPELINVLGFQDIVVASNFLCHMAPVDAEECLRNITSLVGPGGQLLVSSVDLDVRTKVALDLGWNRCWHCWRRFTTVTLACEPTGPGHGGGSSCSTNRGPTGKRATL